MTVEEIKAYAETMLALAGTELNPGGRAGLIAAVINSCGAPTKP